MNELKQQHGNPSMLPPLLNRSPPMVQTSSTENADTDTTLHSQGTTIWELFYSGIWIGSIDRQKLYRVAAICKRDSIKPEQIISEFKRWVEQCRMIGSPRTDHLPVLVKFNVFRAFMSNARDLGISDKESMDDDALSPYSDPRHPSRFISVAPAALQPTKLQWQKCHHPWIDTIPIPSMRDNLLLAGDSYDDVKLCADLVGIHGESTDRNGMIVWGDPWDPASWEVTESFAKYWGWTIRGCEPLFKSTNYWREQRGEEVLSFERLLYSAKGSDSQEYL
jgi:hypothetical protein